MLPYATFSEYPRSMSELLELSTSISVGHQCGYVPEEAINKVYARVGGGDSMYHLTAKLSVYQIE